MLIWIGVYLAISFPFAILVGKCMAFGMGSDLTEQS